MLKYHGNVLATYREFAGDVLALRKYHVNYSEAIFEWISEWNECTEVFEVLC